MIRKFLRNLFSPTSTFSREVRKIFRPSLEVLEDRCVPATFTWKNAGGDNLWSNGANWERMGDGGAIPGAMDTVVFDKPVTANAVVNQDFIVKELWIKPEYTGTIVLDGKNLTVTTSAVQEDGTLNCEGTFTIAAGGTYK